MKTVLFFRHGKSDWDADFGHDHERPINERGRQAARTMGKMLTDLGQAPHHTVCSTAVRARQTLTLAQDAGEWTAPVTFEECLYHGGPDDLLAVIRAADDSVRRLMLVGHEPGWSETISACIGGGAVRFPTAAMARVDFDADRWDAARFGPARLIWLMPPKLFAT
jgi:phosphohistidine phosphatase